MDESDLPSKAVERADGKPVEVAGYVISKYLKAPLRDQKALAAEAESHAIEGDILGVWRCDVCRSRFGVNELDMVLGVPDPIPICPSIGCSGAGWDSVHPDG